MNYYRVDNEIPVKPIDSIETRYYLCFWVVDKPKVLAAIATVWRVSDFNRIGHAEGAERRKLRTGDFSDA